MEVKILGVGCPKCRRLEQLTRMAAAEAGIEIQVVKVEDPADIMAYDIVMTPGLVIGGVLKSAGRIPRKEEIIAWLRDAAG